MITNREGFSLHPPPPIPTPRQRKRPQPRVPRRGRGRGGWSTSGPRPPWGETAGGEPSSLWPPRPFPPPCSYPYPSLALERHSSGERAGAEVVATGRGESGVSPLLNSPGPAGSDASFASSPIYFPFLLRTAPERQLRSESAPPVRFQSPQLVGWGARGCGGWQECLGEAWTRNRVFPLVATQTTC